ncbi:MAG: hypothetical protein PWP65_189 [Clostridia bacterium]|nr:hypothetical protein [Clostridia bacterium]
MEGYSGTGGLNPRAARSELNDYILLAKETLKEMRKIIFDLRPMALDDLDLIPACN